MVTVTFITTWLMLACLSLRGMLWVNERQCGGSKPDEIAFYAIFSLIAAPIMALIAGILALAETDR